MFEVLIDALIDTLKIAPILIIIYILIEFIENRTTFKIRSRKLLKGRIAPVAGAAAGLIPQCGFSVMATDMFSKKYLTAGTLLAVYISTSDEAVPILLSDVQNAGKLVPLLAIKFIIAVIAGITVDLFLSNRNKAQGVLGKSGMCAACRDTCGHDEEGHEGHENPEGEKGHENLECGGLCCSSHSHKGENTAHILFFNPLKHSLKVLSFILIINIVFGLSFYFAGEDAIIGFLTANNMLQPLLTALIGLIPNCASSVVITQLYAIDAISLGSALSGLIVNAGIALAVLFKMNKNLKENLWITVSLFLIGVISGFTVTFLL